MRPLLLAFLLVSSAVAAPTPLQLQRAATLKAIGAYGLSHDGLISRCGPRFAESHNDLYAFPTGRVDRVYIETFGQAFAYRVSGGTARLVWCGSAVIPEHRGSRLAGTAVQAFGAPLRTASGAFPIERGGMDVFRQLVYLLTSERLNAKGQLVCSRTYSLSASDFALPDYSPVNYTCP